MLFFERAFGFFFLGLVFDLGFFFHGGEGVVWFSLVCLIKELISLLQKHSVLLHLKCFFLRDGFYSYTNIFFSL